MRVQKLMNLAETAGLRQKMDAMFAGEHINVTEDRAVLHTALRASRKAVIEDEGHNVVPDVWKVRTHMRYYLSTTSPLFSPFMVTGPRACHRCAPVRAQSRLIWSEIIKGAGVQVLDKIKSFSNKVRNGEWVGHTGKPLKTVVCIGIGGSYLGPLFVHTALATDQSAMVGASGRTLRFLANVDPIDVAKALKGAPPPPQSILPCRRVLFTGLRSCILVLWYALHLAHDLTCTPCAEHPAPVCAIPVR